jgi:ADP-ribosylglycohydrolase
MIGAIAGDIIGSRYERFGKGTAMKSKDFELFTDESRFTDDTALTIATMRALLDGIPFDMAYAFYALKYPKAGYGGRFANWAQSVVQEPYNSFGNGSAMRVSPLGIVYNSIEGTLKKAKESAEVTHNHPEGVKGAQATAAAIYIACEGGDKKEIRDYISENFGYDLNRTVDGIRPNYKFRVSCQKSVPEAIIAFLDSTDWEDAVRNAVSLGGDTDTQACIAGAIAEAFYQEIPSYVIDETFKRIDDHMKIILSAFADRFLDKSERALYKR